MLRAKAAAAIAVLAPLATASAQDWPTRAVTMVVPYAAGGPVDTLGRILAARLSEILGQQVVVENVGGAGGMTGSSRVAKAAPDGYTVLALRQRRSRHQPDALQEAALQRGQRLRARRAVLGLGAGADHAQGSSRPTRCRNSSLTPRPTRERCNTARPGPARACTYAPSCSTSPWAPRSRMCPIAARRRRCRI